MQYNIVQCFKNNNVRTIFNCLYMKILIVSIGALLFGSLYTIFRKYQGVVKLTESDQQFNQPLIQALVIFIGMSTMTIFSRCIPQQKQPNNNKPNDNKYLYIVPSIFDVTGTITDTAGLFYTSLSVSQMLKGSVLFFTYLISLWTSKKKFTWKKHFLMLLIIFSLVLIGTSNLENNDQKFQSNPLLGNSLIVISQFLFALMFIAQERISNNYNMNVSRAVSWEGIWSTLLTLIAVIVFSGIQHSPIQCDIMESCQLLYQNSNLMVGLAITALSIGPFNYFGLLITKYTSALQRCMVCTSRMVIVWIFSIIIGWETFNYVQFIGYLLMVISIEKFNSISNSEYESVTQNVKQQNIQQIEPCQHTQDTLADFKTDESSRNIVLASEI